MRSQEYNKCELTELKVDIEKNVLEDFHRMSENTGYELADLVVIAMKRFSASHSDFLGIIKPE